MPPGQANKLGLVTNRQALRADRIVNANAFRASRFAALSALTPRTRIIAPVEAVRFVGQPLSAVTPLMALSPLPVTASYLYPDTPNYYYQYGGGYLYQVDRGSNLISALLPLLAGGYMAPTRSSGCSKPRASPLARSTAIRAKCSVSGQSPRLNRVKCGS